MNLFWRRFFFSFIAALIFGCAIGLILGNMKAPAATASSLVRIR